MGWSAVQDCRRLAFPPARTKTRQRRIGYGFDRAFAFGPRPASFLEAAAAGTFFDITFPAAVFLAGAGAAFAAAGFFAGAAAADFFAGAAAAFDFAAAARGFFLSTMPTASATGVMTCSWAASAAWVTAPAAAPAACTTTALAFDRVLASAAGFFFAI